MNLLQYLKVERLIPVYALVKKQSDEGLVLKILLGEKTYLLVLSRDQ